MKKKLIIALSVLLGLIATALTLCFTVFTVKTVDLDFRTSTTLEWSTEEILQSAKIQKGKCVLFLSKKGYVASLEKNNPYLEVINIETVFPSKLIIHCAERRELFAIQNESEIVFCDKDLKVLRKGYGTFDSTKENAILLKNLTASGEYEVGDFIDAEEKGIKRFFSSMVENSKTYPQTLGFFKEISLERVDNPLSNEKEDNMIIKTFSDREIKILNIDLYLTRKLNYVFQALSGLYDLLVTNGDYTSEEVDRCSLVVGNQITISGTKIIQTEELYVHIYLDGKVIESPKKNKN